MDKPILTFQQFERNWRDKLKTKPKYIRKGQSLMNYLSEVWMNEYERLSSINYYDRNDIDCFYNDKLIPNTLKHLQEVWKK